MGFGNKELAEYLQKVIADYQKDKNTTRVLRRLHIKEVHLQRKSNGKGLKTLKQFKNFLEV
jgi:predicted negative regulator of RcsB-dependent stress response